MSKLICFSTGKSIQQYSQELKKLATYDTLVYGDAFRFVVDNLNITPKYWIFADPHAIIPSIQLLKKRQEQYTTTLFVFVPMMNSLELSKQYHGTPGRHPNYDWKRNGFSKFNRDINHISQYVGIVRLDTNSYKNIYYNSTKDVKKRMCSMLQAEQFHILPVHGFSGDKLHSIVLPFVTTVLEYDNIYLAGFDGKGPRYNHPTGIGKQRNMAEMQDTFLPFWQSWLQQMNKNVYSLMPDSISRTNKFFPYVPIKDLLSES